MRQSREFKKLLAASFISQSGSHFLTLALAAFTLISSGSPVQSALVFVVSFLPSILVSAKLGHWVDGKISRWLIARNELVSIISTILCGLIIAYHLPLALLCIVLGFRSLLMFISRAAATKWLKLITPPELQINRIKLFYLSFFLSTALSGVLAGVVLAHASIWTIVGLDSASYLLGVSLILALKEVANTSISPALGAPEPKLTETLSEIFNMPAVRSSFLVVCFSQALFQGAYSALVSVLPIQRFGLGLSGVGSFQIAASIGITGGFLANWLLPKALTEKSTVFPARAIGLALFGIANLMFSVLSPIVSTSIMAFCLLNLCYECIWLHHNSEFFRASPKASAARYQFTLSACAAFLMALSTLGFAAAVEYTDIATGAFISVGAGLTIILLASFSVRKTTALLDMGRSVE